MNPTNMVLIKNKDDARHQSLKIEVKKYMQIFQNSNVNYIDADKEFLYT
jgi:hypothetical protein